MLYVDVCCVVLTGLSLRFYFREIYAALNNICCFVRCEVYAALKKYMLFCEIYLFIDGY